MKNSKAKFVSSPLKLLDDMQGVLISAPPGDKTGGRRHQQHNYKT